MALQEDVLTLTDLIYAAAEDAAVWENFLERLSLLLDSKMTVLMYQDLRKQSATIGSAARIDPEALQLYADHYAERNVFFIEGREALVTGSLLVDSIIPTEKLLGSEYYNDYLRPFDVRYSAGVVMFNDNGVVSMLSTMRSKRRGPFGEEEFAVLRALRPHLQRGMQIHRRLFAAEERVTLAAGALDALENGVVLIDEKGVIASVNRSAAEMIDASDGLLIGHCQLRALSPSDDRRLSHLISEALCTVGGLCLASGGSTLVTRPSGRRPYQLIVAPLQTAVRKDGCHCVVVFISDPERKMEQIAAAFQTLYGFSPAETSVAVRILGGESVAEIACSLFVSVPTVRTHLSRLFTKTGTSRQAELVALLASIPSLR